MAWFSRAAPAPRLEAEGQRIALLASGLGAAELLLLAPLLDRLKQAGAAQLKLIAPAEALAWLRPLALPAQLLPDDPQAKDMKLSRVTLGVDLEGDGRLAAALPEETAVLTAPAPKDAEHELKRLQAALAPLGPLPGAAPLTLKQTKAESAPPRLLLLPGLGAPGLSEGGWLRLARGLIEAGQAIALGGAATEAPALRQLKRRLPKDTPVYAGKSAHRLARQIAEAPLLIGADPQPGLRLAQLLDRPCLGIYGARAPLRFGPPYPSRRAIAVCPPKQAGLHDPEGLLVQDILRRSKLLLARSLAGPPAAALLLWLLRRWGRLARLRHRLGLAPALTLRAAERGV